MGGEHFELTDLKSPFEGVQGSSSEAELKTSASQALVSDVQVRHRFDEASPPPKDFKFWMCIVSVMFASFLMTLEMVSSDLLTHCVPFNGIWYRVALELPFR